MVAYGWEPKAGDGFLHQAGVDATARHCVDALQAMTDAEERAWLARTLVRLRLGTVGAEELPGFVAATTT